MDYILSNSYWSISILPKVIVKGSLSHYTGCWVASCVDFSGCKSHDFSSCTLSPAAALRPLLTARCFPQCNHDKLCVTLRLKLRFYIQPWKLNLTERSERFDHNHISPYQWFYLTVLVYTVCHNFVTFAVD